jgi:hypothetical protein
MSSLIVNVVFYIEASGIYLTQKDLQNTNTSVFSRDKLCNRRKKQLLTIELVERAVGSIPKKRVEAAVHLPPDIRH